MKIFRKIFLFIFFGGVYGFLILLGWGLGNVKGFFTHPVRVIMIAEQLLIALIAVIFMEKMNVKLMSGGQKEKEVASQKIMPILGFLAGYAVVFLSPYSDSHSLLKLGSSNILRYIGVVVFTIANIFQVWAPIQLGKQFSFRITVQEGHKLITNGPYKFVRHPRYMGVFSWFLGIGIIYLSIIGIILGFVMLSIFIWTIKDEEKMLHKEFGEEWGEYCKHTKKLIPFIY